MAKNQKAKYAPRNPYEPEKPVDPKKNPRFSRQGTRYEDQAKAAEKAPKKKAPKKKAK